MLGRAARSAELLLEKRLYPKLSTIQSAPCQPLCFLLAEAVLPLPSLAAAQEERRQRGSGNHHNRPEKAGDPLSRVPRVPREPYSPDVKSLQTSALLFEA